MEWVTINFNFINNDKGNLKELKDEMGSYKF